MTKQLWYKCLRSMVLSTVATLGTFVVFSILIVAVLNSIENDTIQDLAIYAIILIADAIFLYVFRMRNRLDTYAEHTGKFDTKKELIAYIKNEGKVMFMLYGIIALVSEISFLVLFFMNQPRNPVTFVTQFCIGPWINIMTVPVLRSVVAVVYSAVIVCLLAILRSRKIYQDDTTAKAQRKRLQE